MALKMAVARLDAAVGDCSNGVDKEAAEMLQLDDNILLAVYKNK